MKCYQAKTGELSAQWFTIDAEGQVVGRLAAQIAPILMGKHRPTYTPHVDTGDYVVVTNVEKVVFSGDKWQQKTYQRYSGHPGGQREETAANLLARRPEQILELAIKRMMPKNKLSRHMMDKLKLYVGPDHPHQAQNPAPLEPCAGRPAPSGAILTPPPAPRKRRARPAAEAAATTEAAAPVVEATTPAAPAEEASAAPETPAAE